MVEILDKYILMNKPDAFSCLIDQSYCRQLSIVNETATPNKAMV